MKKHHTFCENCREEVSYTVTSAPMSGTIRGTEYPYSGKESTCSNCGAPVYVAEINDFNLKALYDEFRKANGIISLEHILEIPKKYDIGKRPYHCFWDGESRHFPVTAMVICQPDSTQIF